MQLNQANLQAWNAQFYQWARNNLNQLNFQAEKNGGVPNQHQNCNYIRQMVTYLNSAPANLRYGDSRINSGISKYLDPMGNINGELTEKERFLFSENGGTVDRDSSAYLTNPYNRANGPNGIAYWYWKSSTGLFQHNINNRVIYWTRCSKNQPVCE